MSEFAERTADLAKRSKAAERSALTEEATKTAVILPFIQMLGFDVFSLDEVVPEFTADVGIKRGEKVDFAVKIDGNVAMLVEAKPINSKLGDAQFNQLFRYFSVTEARLGVLTNGREAWFFSDTDEPNKMDKKPFFKFDFQNHEADQVEELARFRKATFEIDAIIEAASNLKYVRAAANYLKSQLDNPDENFVRFIAKSIHDGQVTKGVVEQLTPAIQSGLDQIIRDRIQDKLGIAFSDRSEPIERSDEGDEEDSDGIVTTPAEQEAFLIVRAIGSRYVPVDRIVIRDQKTYCSVLMDNNNRKPICRFYFNSVKTKTVGVFSSDKVEEKHLIDNPSDIFGLASKIEENIRSYE